METTYTVPTDQKKVITVESQLVYAMWAQGRAYAGFDAEFEVKTILVGSGAKVKVTCFTDKGKKIGKTEGVIVSDRYRGKILISEKVKVDDFVYLEVELPTHKLSGESNSVPVRVPIEVSSMEWSKQEVARDEEVGLCCTFTNGVEEGDEVTIVVYEYDNDGNHDKVVSLPAVVKNNKVELTWNFIYQEDTDDIPTDEELQKYGKAYNPPEYFFVVVVDGITIGKKQESGILNFKDWLEIEYLNGKGETVPNIEYTITFVDGTTRDGKTAANGKTIEKNIPPGKVGVEFKEE